MDGEEENIGPFRRTSARTRRMASRMASALASSDNRAQVTRRFKSTGCSCLPFFLLFQAAIYALLPGYGYLIICDATQAALARLEALESDNAGVEVVDLNDDDPRRLMTQERNHRQLSRSLARLSPESCAKDNCKGQEFARG